MIYNVLSIAGSDPSGGAGVQADLKAISANGAYAMCAITALTAQNTTGVSGIHLPPPEFVKQQIITVFEDIAVHAIKIGMIANEAIANAVADAIAHAVQDASQRPGNAKLHVVLDPVMIAKGGAALLEADAVNTLRDRLVPLSTVLTPNLPEAADLLGMPVAQSREAMQAQADALLQLGVENVFLKGGHLEGDKSPDCLTSDKGTHWFESDRLPTANTHGTGCTLSAAIAALLAQGNSVEFACEQAKAYVANAIAHSGELQVGHGHGPTHHFAGLWNQ